MHNGALACSDFREKTPPPSPFYFRLTAPGKNISHLRRMQNQIRSDGMYTLRLSNNLGVLIRLWEIHSGPILVRLRLNMHHSWTNPVIRLSWVSCKRTEWLFWGACIYGASSWSMRRGHRLWSQEHRFTKSCSQIYIIGFPYPFFLPCSPLGGLPYQVVSEIRSHSDHWKGRDFGSL